jgi:hypothetical protein
MTARMLAGFTIGYGIALIAALYFTRANTRRAIGAAIAGGVGAMVFLGVLVLGVKVGWWRVGVPSAPGLRALFSIATAISLAPIYPVTWRVARRFGWRGLAACIIAAGIIGPPRDYMIAALHPEWITFAPGFVPVLAVSVIYTGFVAAGHAIMRFVAGPARADRLARRPFMKPARDLRSV